MKDAQRFNAAQFGVHDMGPGTIAPDTLKAPPLCPWVDLKSIPRLNASHTVYDSKELTVGDMHANAHKLLDDGVRKGYFAIHSEDGWLELVDFIENAVPLLSPEQRKRMQALEQQIDELSKPMRHRTSNGSRRYSQLSLAKVAIDQTEGGLQSHVSMAMPCDADNSRMKGSKYQSVVPLDILCDQDADFSRDVQALIQKVYIDRKPKLVDLSETGAIMYSHAPITGEMLQEIVEYAVPEVADADTATQVAALNAWFAEVVSDRERYLKETRWVGGANLTAREPSPRVKFVTHVGADLSSVQPVRVNLALPHGVDCVVHGHTKSILRLTASGNIDDKAHTTAVAKGLEHGWFENAQCGSQYISLDSNVGESGYQDNSAGHCRYLAVPKDPRAGLHQAPLHSIELPPLGAVFG